MSGQHPALARSEPGIELDDEGTDKAQRESIAALSAVSRRARRDTGSPAWARNGGGAALGLAAAVATPSSPRVHTTLSGAAGIISPGDPPATPRSRKRLFGISVGAGGLATCGVLALVLARDLGGDAGAPAQVAASPPSATQPSATPPSAVPVAPSPTGTPAETPPPASTPTAPTPAPPSADAGPAPKPAAATTPAPTPATTEPPAKATSAAKPAKRPAPLPTAKAKPSSAASDEDEEEDDDKTAPAAPSRWQATEVKIYIESFPPGATIYRGDAYFGKAPQKIGLTRGDYEYKFELRLPGYQDQVIVVRPLDDMHKEVKLERAPASLPAPSSSSPPAAPTP
jgi:hypothetical protein